MKELKRFLQIAGLNGSQKVNELLLDCSENKVVVCCKSPDNASGINIALNGNPFGVKEKIGITDVEKLVKYLDLIGDDYKIKIEANRINVKGGNKSAKILLKDPQFLEELNITTKKFDGIAQVNKDSLVLELNVAQLKSIQDYFNTTKSKKVELNIVDNKLTMNIGEEDTDILSVELPVTGNGSKYRAKLSIAFVDAIQNLKGEVQLVLNKEEGNPVVMLFKEENIDGKLLFAQTN